jgi:broad specificity phosphatase PhoE
LFAERDAGVVAIAGHAGVNRVILCDVLGMPLANLFRIAQRPGCVNVIESGRNGPVARLVNGEAP